MRTCSCPSKRRQSYLKWDDQPIKDGTILDSRTTSSDITSKLNSSAIAAIFSNSFLEKTLPTGLWGVLRMITLARGVMARLWIGYRDGKERGFDIPQFIKVDPPVVAVWPLTGQVRVQGNINGFSAVEGDRRKVLIEERLEHDDLVALLQERGEYRVLTW